MTEVRDLHHIQVKILRRLSKESPLRFSDLQPASVANNVFAYHLKKMLDTGYIRQNSDSHYEPTRKALKLLSYSDEPGSSSRSPIMLTMLFVNNDDDEALLIKRTAQPFPGFYGLPSGLVHHDERIEDAARRELAEKTGLRSSRPLEFAGVLDFRYLHRETNDVFVHAVAFVYKHTVKPNQFSQLKTEGVSWSSLDRSDILPEVNAVKLMVSSSSPGVTSLSFIEPSPTLSNTLDLDI